MARQTSIVTVLVLQLAAGIAGAANTVEVPRAEWEKMKADIEELRRERAAMPREEWEKMKADLQDLRKVTSVPPATPAEKALARYGREAPVTTKNGKLTMGGLVQVWYYSIAHDGQGLFASHATKIQDSNAANDNNGFRIRRTELVFRLDLDEHVSTYVMIDPSRELMAGFPTFPDNQGIPKRINNLNPEWATLQKLPGGSTSQISNLQSGNGSAAPRMLQDAYINYHDIVPHHDFQIGQFTPPVGEEGLRWGALLDFAERAMITQPANNRDLGVQAHGVWWDRRFQYWVGAFDGAGNYFGSAGASSNRADDNNDKDLALRALVRPVWKAGGWGDLELGGSTEFGNHGQDGVRDPLNYPVDGLNRPETAAMRHYAWLYYAPGGPAKGLWIRSEWGFMHDRNAPGTVIDLFGQGTTGKGYLQGDPLPTSIWGLYAAAGYKISDSRYADTVPSWFKPFEFLFRYEHAQNTQIATIGAPAQTSAFFTDVYTTGISYYLNGHYSKIELNFNVVENPTFQGLFHHVNNNNLLLNFQMAF